MARAEHVDSAALPALSLVRDVVSAVDLRELDVYLADDGYYAAGRGMSRLGGVGVAACQVGEGGFELGRADDLDVGIEPADVGGQADP